ncbi:MAG TPA: TerB family tellurite resistance protein [Polyangia bacterium]|nr:TerB family tellurite resistance protein [Polyangia bacterium]
MDLHDLNDDERTALVGLVKAVIFADGRISDDERDEVAEIVEALGEDAYQKHMDAFEERFPDEPAFQKFLTTITRQEARELIYGTILDGAAADAIEGNESELLSWLASAWDLEVTVAD